MLSKKTENKIGALISALISTIVILISMRIWEVDANVPVALGDDGSLVGLLCKSIYQYGLKGAYFNPSLGAPEVSELVDTPFFDLNLILETFLLSNFLPSANSIVYILYILTFPFAALTMYFLLCKLLRSTFLKVFLSIAYAITPYHFFRGMGHLTLSHYYVIPIALYLMILVYEEEFSGIMPTRYRSQKWKTIIMYAACIILGTGNIYYAFFGLFCVSCAFLGKLINKKNITSFFQSFIHEACVIYAIFIGVFIGLLPKIIYTIQNGKNEVAGSRIPLESEMYALKIIQLLLPTQTNRIRSLAELNLTYSSNAVDINENSWSSLGVIASIGFLVSCIWIIVRIVSKKGEEKIHTQASRINLYSFTILAILLYSMAGGFGAFVNYWITPEIRCFNRSSIFIAALSLCILGIMGEEFLARKKKYLGYVQYAIWGGLGVFVLYSEVPINNSGWQNNLKQKDESLTAFFDEVEGSLSDNAMVYELPYMNFPENGPIVDMEDYEPAIGYLYSDNIRWSYGGMRGRESVAESLFVDDGMSMSFIKGLLDTGYSGVYIDTKGYEDGGKKIISFYSDTLDLTPIISNDGWLYFYNIERAKIDNRMLVTGYQFVSEFSDRLGRLEDIELNSNLADELKNTDEDAIAILWSWICQSEYASLSDKDYISFLYKAILERSESEKENIGWTNQLENGISREDVLRSFLSSEEFRIRNGYY